LLAYGGEPERLLERFERSAPMRGARIGVAVAPLEGELQYLVSREPDRPLVPASNQKILLAAAALEQWGAAHRFETPMLAERPLGPGGRLTGPLWVKGSGDPSLTTEQLWRMAEELRLTGVREIQGGIAVDVSYFDALRAHPDWAPLSRRAYHAPVSAFAANYSSFRIEVVGAEKPGVPAQVRVAPELDYFHVASAVGTRSRGGPLLLDVIPLPDQSGERVTVRGSLRAGRSPETFWRSVALPEVYAASLLRRMLEAQGVSVAGSVRIGQVPDDAVELVRFKGAPLAEILRDLNKWSNNFVAEQLLKSLGAAVYGPPGSWTDGARALRSDLERRGLDSPSLSVVDGSGLSTRNRLSASTLVGVIRSAAADFRYGPEFLASLPLGGLDGTLEKRMEGLPGRVRGKTGHLSAVVSLAGITGDAQGRRLAFAVLVNGARGGALAVDQAIDAFVSDLSRVEAAELATRDGSLANSAQVRRAGSSASTLVE
jgi:D-alanyl-D-alanine carboxypeptidase/D-alanyl-D-alanine-endopeptidase (penicillin-binding protein 4)